jgi:hypothetical protein
MVSRERKSFKNKLIGGKSAMPEKLAHTAGSVTGIDSKQAIKEAVCVHTATIIKSMNTSLIFYLSCSIL